MRRIALLLFLLPSFPIFACDCSTEIELSLEYHRTQHVIIGKVLSITESKDGQELLVSVEIKTDFKGEKTGEKMIIRTNSSPKACGYTFAVGKEYLIYANRHQRVPKDWATSVCSRTIAMSGAENDLIFITRELQIAMDPAWEKQFKD
jgi:hypothetical protein